MTKNRALLILLIAIVGIVYMSQDKTVSHKVKEIAQGLTPTNASQASSSPRALSEVSSKEVNGREPSSKKEDATTLNTWEEKLEANLTAQGGAQLKEIHIKKEKAFSYKQDGHNLAVQSVVVTLKNQKDEESSFRALVDSQTGKIVQAWDHSISDPANVREGFRFKLDARYTN